MATMDKQLRLLHHSGRHDSRRGRVPAFEKIPHRRDSQYGSIEPGKKANLVIFDKSPFDDYKNFLSNKMVIKDGKVYQN